MSVRAAAWRPYAAPMAGPRRDVPWIVPVVALVLATLPAWLGIEVGLPRPLAREISILVVSEEPKPAPSQVEALPAEADRLDTLVQLPVEDAAARIFPAPEPGMAKPPRQPALAVAGVGVQGLVIRSEPAGGERIRVVDEGTDLRDLDEAEQAGG